MNNLRVLDHVVLSVKSLSVARDRLEKLGFQVANNALHPFGTENACVYFSDETYLEPLAVRDIDTLQGAIDGGNNFARLFAQFRNGGDLEGFPAVALKSGDVPADHRQFLEAGISGGGMLEFSRPLRRPDGSESVASFKLAFSVSPDNPDFYVFSCQRINVPSLASGALLDHANGVAGIREVILRRGSKVSGGTYLSAVFGHSSKSGDFSVFDMNGSKLRVMDDTEFENAFGVAADAKNEGLSGIAVVFAVGDARKAAKLFADAGVRHLVQEQRVVVPADSGQGAIFVFEEEPA